MSALTTAAAAAQARATVLVCKARSSGDSVERARCFLLAARCHMRAAVELEEAGELLDAKDAWLESSRCWAMTGRVAESLETEIWLSRCNASLARIGGES